MAYTIGMLSCLPPISTPTARVLILGSMPGARSLQRQQYYAHPQNAFWRIIARVYGAAPTYTARVRGLARHRIALWDVIATCRRAGSADSAILCPAANDLERFVRRHPQLRTVVLNGGTAARYYRAYVKDHPALARLRVRCVPSTSPAHTIPFARKLRAWRRALQR